MSRRLRRGLQALCSVLGADIAAVLGLILIAGCPDRAQELDRVGSADAVVIFYSPIPSDLAERVKTARAVYAARKAENIVCVGGARPERDFFGCKEVGDRLVADGVDRARVTVDLVSHTTELNLAALHRIAVERSFQSVILVSDPLHLLRIRPDARRLGVPKDIASFASRYPNIPYVLFRGQWEVVAWLLRILPSPVVQLLVRLTR